MTSGQHYPTSSELVIAARLLGPDRDIQKLADVLRDWTSTKIIERDCAWFMTFPLLKDIPSDEIVPRIRSEFRRALGSTSVVYETCPDVDISSSFEEHGNNGQTNLIVHTMGPSASVALSRIGESKDQNFLAEKICLRASADEDVSVLVESLAATPDWGQLRRAFEILERIFGNGQRSKLANVSGIDKVDLDDLYNSLSQPGHDPARHRPARKHSYTLAQSTRFVCRLARILLATQTTPQ